MIGLENRWPGVTCLFVLCFPRQYWNHLHFSSLLREKKIQFACQKLFSVGFTKLVVECWTFVQRSLTKQKLLGPCSACEVARMKAVWPGYLCQVQKGAVSPSYLCQDAIEGQVDSCRAGTSHAAKEFRRVSVGDVTVGRTGSLKMGQTRGRGELVGPRGPQGGGRSSPPESPN